MSLRLTLLAGVASIAASAAQSPQTPVFRSRIDVVPVAVTVVDRKGKPVTDLLASDFVVTENGQRREIVSFHPQMFGTEASNAAAPSILTPSRRRTFVILLGYGLRRFPDPGKGVEGALAFVRERLIPGDQVAVLAFHRATNLTSDHAKIIRVLERYKDTYKDLLFEVQLHFLATRGYGRGGPPIPDALLTKIDERVFGSGEERLPLRQLDGLLLGMDRATPVVDRAGQTPLTFAEMSDRLARFGVNLRDATVTSSRLKLHAGVELLRWQDGDKHLVVVGDTPVTFSRDDARVLARRATDARVAIDFVWTQGTGARSSGCLPCRDLTGLTGGYYTSLEVASEALARIDEGTRFSYLLGYAPTSTTLDGKYRAIGVKVNRPDVDVRFRHGYYAAAEPDPLELREAISRTVTDAASTYDLAASDLAVSVTAERVPETGVPREIRVDVKIGVAELGLVAEAGRYKGQLELRVYCGDAKEKVVGSQGATMVLDATSDTFARWQRDGLRNTLTVPVTSTPRFVKVIVFDPGSNRAGSAIITLQRK